MESGQFLTIFSSWEVILACLLMILILPIVFYVASQRTPRRRVLPARPTPVRAVKPARKAEDQEREGAEEVPRRGSPPQRGVEPPDAAGARE